MAIPAINVLGNPNVTEGNFQIAIEDLRKSVIGSGKAYDSANTYSQYDTCVSGGIVYYSKINSNTGNTPAVNANWGLIGDLITGIVHNVGNESIDGTKTFSTSPIVPTPTTTGNIITMDNIIQKTPVGIGYGSGSGGTVTQLTSKSTNVTLHKPTGTIITNSAALAVGETAQFSVVCSLVQEHDTIQINCKYAGGSGLNYDVNTVSNNGDFVVQIKNKDTVSRRDVVYITYTIIKGATA